MNATRTKKSDFGLIFMAIIGSLIAILCFIFMLKPELDANSYLETTCTLLDERMETIQGDDPSKLSYRPLFKIQYAVEGETYEIETYRSTKFAYRNSSYCKDAINKFDVGSEYPCWYNPINHEQAVIEKGVTLFPVLLTVIGAIVGLIGIVGIGRRKFGPN